MNIDQTISDLSTLSVDDRLRVLHAIWDTLPDDVELHPSPEQQAELDRRLDAHRTNPSTSISHDELMRRIEVEDDVIAAVVWYDDKRAGLGDEFLSEYPAAIQRIRDNPLMFAIAANGLRPCRLKRFAYVIHFDVTAQDVLIIAVMGSGRDDSAFIRRKG